MTTNRTTPRDHPGAKIYSKFVLRIYDALVVRFSNSLAWRCRSPIMLGQYNRHLGQRHLDVGPGTGWFLDAATMPDNAEIVLMDLNTNSLDSTRTRLEHKHPVQTVLGNVLEPLPSSIGSFDSIAINYLIHCLHGSMAEKAQAFGYLGQHLSPGGTLFGSTILGSGVRHNLIGRILLKIYNRRGIFDNYDDDATSLRTCLEASFETVSVTTVGTVAMFTAADPRS